MGSNFLKILTPFLHQKAVMMALLLALGACRPNNSDQKDSPQGATRVITDMNGRQVEIPQAVTKVVAHRSGALRMICYLKATDKVIGVEENERRRNVPYLYANPELRNLPVIGSGNTLDPELVVAIKPEVLICTYLTTGEANELQQKTGVPVVCLNNGDFNAGKGDFYQSLRLLGNILDKSARADSLIAYLEDSLKQIQQTCSRQPLADSVYVGGIAYSGAHGITSTEPDYAPFRYTNTYNLAAALTKSTNAAAFSQLNTLLIDKEQIINWNPSKIFIDVSGYQLARPDLDKTSVFGQLMPAIQQDEVYFLLPHIWNAINYEHILINTYYIAKVLHPEVYGDLNIAAKADEVYVAFLGKPVYQHMLALYGRGCQKITAHD